MKPLLSRNENFNRDNSAGDPACCPIVEKHWLRDERKPGSFAQEAAQSVLGSCWTPPEDIDFRDREPPHIPAPADHQDSDDVVSALRKRRAA